MTAKPSIHFGRNHARATKGPRPDGRYYWQARRFVGGEVREVTSALGWLTEEEAGRELAARIALGGIGPVRASAPPANQHRTVADLLSLYMAARQKAVMSPLTKANNQTAANRLADAIGTVVIEQVSLDVLEDYANTAKLANGEPARSSTVRFDIRILRQAWAWGTTRGLLTLPWPRVRVLDRGDSRPKTAAPLEAVEAVERALREQWPDGWPWRCFHLLAVTGARISELARLTVGDVDLEAGVVRIRGKHTPGKVPYRDFPLLADTVEILRELIALRWEGGSSTAPSPGCANGVVPAAGSTGQLLWGPSPKSVANSLRADHIPRAEEAAKVGHLTPYDIRRATVRRFRQMNVPIKVAADLLGNSPKTILEYYEHATPADLRDAVEQARPGRTLRGNVLKFKVGGEE